MHDISGRLARRRLSRYARPEHPLRRALPWVWALLALWLLWVGLISDHSFYRLWRVGNEEARTQSDLQRAHREIERLESGLRDPAAVRGLAEHVLRERNGMAKPGEIIYRVRPTVDSLRVD